MQRELVDPAAYVELWLKDSGHHPATGGDPAEYRRRYDTWLAWLEEQGVEAIGFGWVNLRAGGRGRHDLWDWPYDVEQPIAPAIARLGGRASPPTSGAGCPARCCAWTSCRRPSARPAPRTRRRSCSASSAASGAPARADTVVAALVGACDGELSVGQILDAVAQLLPRPADARDADRARASTGYLVRAGCVGREAA